MPVPAPNLYPVFNTVRVSHAYLNVHDLAASKQFYADTLAFRSPMRMQSASICAPWKSVGIIV